MSDQINRELGEISATLKGMQAALEALASDNRQVRDDVLAAKAIGRVALWFGGAFAPLAGFMGSVLHSILKNGTN